MSKKSAKKPALYGIAVEDDGQITVTKPRATEDAALALAQRTEATTHFVVEATSAPEARERAVAKMESASEPAIIEPTEEELVEAAKAKAERKVADVGTNRWFLVTLNAEADAEICEGSKEEGYRNLESAQEVSDRIEAIGVPVQAASAYEARSYVDSLGRLPESPVYTSGATGKPARRYTQNFGTEPIDADEYFVNRTGTVHVDQGCRFVRKAIEAGDVKPVPYAGDLVREIQAGAEELNEQFLPNNAAIEVVDGVKAVDYCRFCAVAKAEDLVAS